MLLTWGYFDHHNWGDGGRGTTWYLKWGKARDAAQHPTVHRTAPHKETTNYPVPNVSSAGVEKLSCRLFGTTLTVFTT